MKKTTTKTRSDFAAFLEFLFGIFVVGGCAYFVFEKGASGWWFLLAVVLLCCEFSTERITVEEEEQIHIEMDGQGRATL